MLQDQRLRLLPFGAISTIRSLRINHKPQKSAKDKRTSYKQHKTDKANLINVKKIHKLKHGNITIGTCNIQSVPKKELQVSDLILDCSLDLLVLTETWLTSNHDFWKNATQLNRDNLNLYTADRPQGRGGGLALITKKGLTVSLHDKGTKPSFEFAHWSVKSRNTTLNIHGIYHLPYSLTNKITNQMFIDDFTDCFNIITRSSNQHIHWWLQLTCKWPAGHRLSYLQWLHWSHGSIPACAFPDTQIRECTGLTTKWHNSIHGCPHNSTRTIPVWPLSSNSNT